MTETLRRGTRQISLPQRLGDCLLEWPHVPGIILRGGVPNRAGIRQGSAASTEVDERTSETTIGEGASGMESDRSSQITSEQLRSGRDDQVVDRREADPHHGAGENHRGQHVPPVQDAECIRMLQEQLVQMRQNLDRDLATLQQMSLRLRTPEVRPPLDDSAVAPSQSGENVRWSDRRPNLAMDDFWGRPPSYRRHEQSYTGGGRSQGDPGNDQ